MPQSYVFVDRLLVRFFLPKVSLLVFHQNTGWRLVYTWGPPEQKHGTPIKHISRKNQCIFGVGLANHLILLVAKFLDADEARKTWCGKYLIKANKLLDLYDNYVNKTW